MVPIYFMKAKLLKLQNQEINEKNLRVCRVSI